MKLLKLSALTLSVSVIAGCRPAHDPAKWYLTGYQSEQFLIQHEHKLYTAKCTDSWRGGPASKDSTPDCSGLLTSVGLGQEIPELNHDSTSWVVTGGGAEYVTDGIGSNGSGPEYMFKFVSIKENGADSSDVDQGYGVKAIRVPAIPIRVGAQRRWRD